MGCTVAADGAAVHGEGGTGSDIHAAAVVVGVSAGAHAGLLRAAVLERQGPFDIEDPASSHRTGTVAVQCIAVQIQSDAPAGRDTQVGSPRAGAQDILLQGDGGLIPPGQLLLQYVPGGIRPHRREDAFRIAEQFGQISLQNYTFYAVYTDNFVRLRWQAVHRTVTNYVYFLTIIHRIVNFLTQMAIAFPFFVC